jgi:N-acetylmuramoyl-L-alanine amidase
MINLVTRAEWGARRPKGRTSLTGKAVLGMAIHYSAMAAVEDHSGCDDRVRQIQNGHMDGNGWDDIAYNFLTCHHGYTFEGRGWDVRSAANGTDAGNDHYLATCFLGLDREGRDDVTKAGRDAIRAVAQTCDNRYVFGNLNKGHRDFKATACPGNELYAWVKAGMPMDASDPLPSPPQDIAVAAPPVALLPHALGYWIVTSDGGVFTFGNAPFLGSVGGQTLNAPIIDAGVTKDGEGYWLQAADGGIFGFGNATFHGSTGDIVLNKPMVSFAATLDNAGYWQLGEDGGMFAHDAPFYGRVVFKG